MAGVFVNHPIDERIAKKQRKFRVHTRNARFTVEDI
jgi:hypothetical protein